MRIVYQKSIVNPQVVIPICHLNGDVGEHVVILRNPERAVSVQSILRPDGGVTHPLLGDTVYENLHSVGSSPLPIPEITSSISQNDSNHQILVTPPRTRSRARHCLSQTTTPWKPKMSLGVLELLTLFEKSIGMSMGNLAFSPMGMSYPKILKNITLTLAPSASAFLRESQQKAILQNDIGSTIQHQVISFLHELKIGPDMECILSAGYPSILTVCPDTYNLTRVLNHPQCSILRLEQNLFMRNNSNHDWSRLLEDSTSISDTGPYSLVMNGLVDSYNESERRMYDIACCYISSMRRSIKDVIDNHGVAPFNVGFALEYWLVVIFNLESGNLFTMGITGEALQLVLDIFEFFMENDTKAWNGGASGSIVFTSDHATVAWLVHPVEHIYQML